MYNNEYDIVALGIDGILRRAKPSPSIENEIVEMVVRQVYL